VAKSSQSKDDTLEALDFIVNVLKENELDLDKLINELSNVTEQLGEPGELNGKVENLEVQIKNLQKEVTNLVSYLSGNAPKEALSAPANTVKEQVNQTQAVPAAVAHSGSSVILKCKQWEDFQSLAFQAQLLSFSYMEDEKVFQSDALKGNQVITYSGELPKLSVVLKTWLSKQLNIPEKNILEGVLAIS
jgi:hypothetical protein